jgi:hypothetical protein
MIVFGEVFGAVRPKAIHVKGGGQPGEHDNELTKMRWLYSVFIRQSQFHNLE